MTVLKKEIFIKVVFILLMALFAILIWLTMMVYTDDDFYDYADESERDVFWGEVDWNEINQQFSAVDIEVAHVAWYDFESNKTTAITLWWCEEEGALKQLGPLIQGDVFKLKGKRCIVRAPRKSRTWHVERSQLTMIEPLSNMEMTLKHVSLRISNQNTPYNMMVSEFESVVKGLVDSSDSPHKWTIHLSQSQLVPYRE